MKKETILPSLVLGLLAVSTLLYMIFSFLETVTDPFSTTVAYQYHVSKSVDTTGVLIRDEVVLPTSSGLVDLLRSEGEQVGVGQIVGRVYRDVFAMEEQNQLEMQIAEAATLEYAITEQKDIMTVRKMDEEIVNAFSSLHLSAMSGNYNKLEQQVSAVKGNVLRRDYIFGSQQVIMELENRFSTLQGIINTSSQTISGSVSNIVTPVSGAYSILVDGLEGISTASAEDLTLLDLSAILDTKDTAVSEGSGKIVTGNYWYFVTALESEWAEALTVGGTVTVRFSGDFAQDISMTVERIGIGTEGQHLVALSTNRYLEQTTLLRIQTVELVFENYIGLRVPKSAMRMETYVDANTEEIVQHLGVYVVSAGYAEFKPVEVLSEGSDYYVVSSQFGGIAALRAGNVVVVNAVGIYDGKLLEY